MILAKEDDAATRDDLELALKEFDAIAKKEGIDVYNNNKPLVSLFTEELVSHAVAKMRKFDISQIPVLKDNKFVGSVDDSAIYQSLVEKPELGDAPISSIMGPPL